MHSNELEELLRALHAMRILIYLLINGPSPRSRISKALSIDYYALERKHRYLEEKGVDS